MATTKRIYKIIDKKTNDSTFVRAVSKTQAVAYLSDQFDVSIADQEELLSLTPDLVKDATLKQESSSGAETGGADSP